MFHPFIGNFDCARDFFNLGIFLKKKNLGKSKYEMRRLNDEVIWVKSNIIWLNQGRFRVSCDLATWWPRGKKIQRLTVVKGVNLPFSNHKNHLGVSRLESSNPKFFKNRNYFKRNVPITDQWVQIASDLFVYFALQTSPNRIQRYDQKQCWARILLKFFGRKSGSKNLKFLFS